MGAFFVELSIVMCIVLIISFIMNYLRQPLLIGYIFAGIVAGPIFLNILSSSEGYETFSHIGISLLLFIVGLHLNLKLIKEVGVIALITGLGQVIFTSFFGFAISYYFLGFGLMASILIAIGLTFSSTIIIVKLLSDKNDLDKLYGKISMGFLIVQDLVAVILLMVLSSFINIDSTQNIFVEASKVFGLTVFAIIMTYFLSKSILPIILDKVAKSTELMFIFVISWCLGVSTIFYFLGSIEVGALLAGIALASSSYQNEISSRIKPLRDFFIVMFFILLGSNMIPSVPGSDSLSVIERLDFIWVSIESLLFPALIFTLFILIGNPLIVLILMGIMGYSSRTGFLAGLTVAQISEFSLILMMMGLNGGFLSSNEVAMVTFVGIFTITGSTYMILNGDFLYNLFSRFLKKFERRKLKEKNVGVSEKSYEVLIFGYDRIGYSLLKSIEKLKKSYLVVDFNPLVIKKLERHKHSCLFGDAGDIDFLSEINMKSTKMVISTIPDSEINSILIKAFKKSNKDGIVLVTANDIDKALDLYHEGSDYVILPHHLGGDYVSTLIEKHDENLADFLTEKIKHINDLKKRKEFDF